MLTCFAAARLARAQGACAGLWLAIPRDVVGSSQELVTELGMWSDQRCPTGTLPGPSQVLTIGGCACCKPASAEPQPSVLGASSPGFPTLSSVPSAAPRPSGAAPKSQAPHRTLGSLSVTFPVRVTYSGPTSWGPTSPQNSQGPPYPFAAWPYVSMARLSTRPRHNMVQKRMCQRVARSFRGRSASGSDGMRGKHGVRRDGVPVSRGLRRKGGCGESAAYNDVSPRQVPRVPPLNTLPHPSHFPPPPSTVRVLLCQGHHGIGGAVGHHGRGPACERQVAQQTGGQEPDVHQSHRHLEHLRASRECEEGLRGKRVLAQCEILKCAGRVWRLHS